MIKKRAKQSVKAILNKNFTFSDLSPRFKNVDSTTGNIFCPFHENHSTPAAKMYWNEEQQIWIIHCFGECHTNFTAYDYVDLILCEKYGKYKSPLHFLQQNMSKEDLYIQLEAYEDQLRYQTDIEENAKIDYISRVADENEKTEDYIEALYLA